MKEKINPDNDGWDLYEEYFKKKDESYEIETENISHKKLQNRLIIKL
tara:strand:+ start:932 stop:1072 length:141 start_codon:yes stop_codon:yes gene_type:complete